VLGILNLADISVVDISVAFLQCSV